MKNLTKTFYAKLLISILFLSIAFAASGQNNEINSQNYLPFRLLTTKEPTKKILNESDISGSPYLNKEFVLGSLLTNERIKYIDVPLRYNIYNDEIEFEMSEDSYLAIEAPETIKKATIGNDEFIYAVKRNKKGDQYGYYQLVSDGKVKLLSRYNIVFEEGTTTTGYKKPRPPRLIRNSNTFYLQIANNEPQQVSAKKDLEAIFGQQSQEMKAFIKKEKLNIRQEADLAKLIKFINKNISLKS